MAASLPAGGRRGQGHRAGRAAGPSSAHQRDPVLLGADQAEHRGELGHAAREPDVARVGGAAGEQREDLGEPAAGRARRRPPARRRPRAPARRRDRRAGRAAARARRAALAASGSRPSSAWTARAKRAGSASRSAAGRVSRPREPRAVARRRRCRRRGGRRGRRRAARRGSGAGRSAPARRGRPSTCAATSARATADGSAGSWSASVGPSSQPGHEHGAARQLGVRRGHHDARDVAQRAAHRALLGGLVLEVELVERLLADPAEQHAGVERGERAARAAGAGRRAGRGRRGRRCRGPARRTLTATGAPPSTPRWTWASGVIATGASRSSASSTLPGGRPQAERSAFSTCLGAQRLARLLARAGQRRLERLAARRGTPPAGRSRRRGRAAAGRWPTGAAAPRPRRGGRAARAGRRFASRRDSGSRSPARAGAQEAAAARRPGQAVRARAGDAVDVDPVVERGEHDLQPPVAVEVGDRRRRGHADAVAVLALVAEPEVVQPPAGGGEHDEPARAPAPGPYVPKTSSGRPSRFRSAATTSDANVFARAARVVVAPQPPAGRPDRVHARRRGPPRRSPAGGRRAGRRGSARGSRSAGTSRRRAGRPACASAAAGGSPCAGAPTAARCRTRRRAP